MNQDEVLRLLNILLTGGPKEKAEVEKALKEWVRDRRKEKINT
jgi:hypothetical protein